MKKILKIISIFISLNVLVFISSFFFWDFMFWKLSNETPYLNPLIFYWMWLFLIFLNIFLVNTYIKKFISKRNLSIVLAIITILFCAYISINWENHEFNRDKELIEDEKDL